MLISEKRLETALATLAETDAEYGAWRAMVLRTEYMAEVTEAMVYNAIETGSVEDKKRAAKVHPDVRRANEDHFQAVSKYETLRARRQREVHIIEIFRTLESSRRQGHIT